MNNKLISNLLPLETKRLLINVSSDADVDLLLKMDKQEQTQKYLGGIKNKSKEERIEFLKRKSNSLTIYLKNKTPIGFVGIGINPENNSAELSYIFDNDYCNKGYCTEACEKIISVCYEDLKVELYKKYKNDRHSYTYEVLEKLGFTCEESNREDFLDYKLLNNTRKNK